MSILSRSAPVRAEIVKITPDMGKIFRRSQWREFRIILLRFLFTGIYLELCLHLCVFRSLNFRILYPVAFGAVWGCVCTAITAPLPRIPCRILTLLLTALHVIIMEVQLVYHAVFGNFLPLSMARMGDTVMVNFGGQILYGIGKNIVPILLILLPLIVMILHIILRKAPGTPVGWRQGLAAVCCAAVILLLTLGIMFITRNEAASVYDIFRNVNASTDTSYKNIGMVATTEQELRYMILGVGRTQRSLSEDALGVSHSPSHYSSREYNVLDSIDFEALASDVEADLAAAEDSDEIERLETLLALDNYFAAVVPTRKNDYTGMLEGYNLITICAESYCPWFISKELTPALYEMTHHGFIFKNYYGSYQSVTTNGEYTMCTGLYPDMSRTKTASSFDASSGNCLPFCLGNALKDKGYLTRAYHNYIGDFYNRNITHPNMGYIFEAAGSGLNIPIDWPSSDLEMMKASVDDYIGRDGPFHAYYMTFSGHYQYNWENAMSAKNREKVENLDYSESVKAYIACNLELEYALEYLMDRLEAAGKADKTCIVLTNDHYPYGLSRDEYSELAGRELDEVYEKYRNSFICYVPGLSEDVQVRSYCSTADILPTLLNLFGVDYDSRLLAGRDVLSSGIHLGILSDKSFLTDTFRFDAGTETASSSLEENYPDEETLRKYRTFVDNQFQFSKDILNTDYYAHVLGITNINNDPAQENPVVFSDINDIFDQASVLYLYRNGYIDPETEDTFGGNSPATLGEYADLLYRIAGRPETDDGHLPENYGTGGFSRAETPYYPAVCWAFAEGLVRQEDSRSLWDEAVDHRTADLLMYRFAQIMGVDTRVDDTVLTLAAQEQSSLTEEELSAIVWCAESNITTRKQTLDDILSDHDAELDRYQMANYVFYLCTYELDLNSL